MVDCHVLMVLLGGIPYDYFNNYYLCGLHIGWIYLRTVVVDIFHIP